MSEARLMGTLERIAGALQEQVNLQKRAPIRLGWLVDEAAEPNDPAE